MASAREEAQQVESKESQKTMTSTSGLVKDVIASLNAEKTWPSDVTLYTLPEDKELMNDVAQCHIVRALFACHGLMDCYTIERRHNAEFMAPNSRKLPFLRTGRTVVAHEDICRFMFDRMYVLRTDMSPTEKITMEGVISLVETKLQPIELYITWLEPVNRKSTYDRYGLDVPQPLKTILCWQKYWEVRKYLKAIGVLDRSEVEMRADISDVYKCLSRRLETSGCLIGEEITEADVFAYGHLQAILESKLSKNILMEELKNFPRLTQFCLNFNQIHLGNKAMIWEFL